MPSHQTVLFFVVLGWAVAVDAQTPLPGTSRLILQRPVHEVMVAGINQYCQRLIAESPARRQARWRGNYSDLETLRDRFRNFIGAQDQRQTIDSDFELLAALPRSSVVARSPSVTVHTVRWAVLPGITVEALVLKPNQIRAAVVALPDANWTPELFCGLGEAAAGRQRFVQRLAAAGCLVVIPTLLSRSNEFSGHPNMLTDQPHREFLYRQAFEVGRHPIGFEVQKVLSVIDRFDPELPVGVIGVGEGGLLALYATALDERIDSTLVSGYFDEREGLWREPISRNVSRLLTEFGDAELAGMVAPRRLVIEACGVDGFNGPTDREGRRKSAAPGRIETCTLPTVKAEHQRAATHYQRLGKASEIRLVVSGPEGKGPAGSSQAVAAFAQALGMEVDSEAVLAEWETLRTPASAEREQRQFDEMQEFVQRLLRECHHTRAARWKADRSSLERWLPTRDRLQDVVHEELIGRLRLKPIPPRPRTRQVIENESYRAYEVVLEVAPDLIAAGILLLPRDLMAGEKRPVVVCQHGLERTSRDTISREPRAYRSYKSFADVLCRRGFIVYAPQNPHIGGDKFRSIQRKANPLGLSLFSFIIEQHRQTLDWLATLPHVDEDRIAFYGLSYGGKTAMRAPPFLDRYCLSICSGDFTDWPHTIANNSKPYSYVFTGEYEIPEWNLGHIASYAELAMLMSPRPFMVEAGLRDRGQPPELVASEFAKVRRHYDQLGISDRAKLEFFDGPHTINGKGAFRFLHRHLNWPEPPGR
jgi:dienelactone hydrolase